jgi:hypothetical protein
VFSYEPDGKDFLIEVRFKGSTDHSKRAVLQALKQAFDDVKNDVVAVP